MSEVGHFPFVNWTLAFFVFATDYTDFHGKAKKSVEIRAIRG